MRPKSVAQSFLESDFYRLGIARLHSVFRTYGFVHGLRALSFLCLNEVRARRKMGALNVLSEKDIEERRKSDTVFVFGSGASLNEISQEEWARIGQHDVIGLNYFVRQSWVDVTIHYVRELELPFRLSGKYDPDAVVRSCRRFCDLLEQNPHYRNTILFLQTDFFSEIGKTIVGWEMLPEGQPLCFYRGTRRGGTEQAPPNNLSEGLPRQAGAIGGGISLGKYFGWKRIVLVGVDLYNSQYFWLPPETARGENVKSANEPHQTVRHGTIEIMGNWAKALNADEISLELYNPKSLLRESLPLFQWEDGLLVQAGSAK